MNCKYCKSHCNIAKSYSEASSDFLPLLSEFFLVFKYREKSSTKKAHRTCPAELLIQDWGWGEQPHLTVKSFIS